MLFDPRFLVYDFLYYYYSEFFFNFLLYEGNSEIFETGLEDMRQIKVNDRIRKFELFYDLDDNLWQQLQFSYRTLNFERKEN